MSKKNEIKVKEIGEKKHVWCIIRKKYLLFTPEEKVRQIFIHYLIEEKQVPKSRIRSEYYLKWNNLAKRCDIVVFSENVYPLVIIECKKETINISNHTLSQLARYNLKLQVEYLVATNAKQTFVFQLNKAKNKFEPIKELPNYDQLLPLVE